MSEAMRFRLVFAVLMSLLMSVLMTGWVTWINVGLRARFWQAWGHAFVLAWPAACAVVLVAAPSVQQLSKLVLAAWSGHGK